MIRKHENIAWGAVWLLLFLLVPATMLRRILSDQSAWAFHHILQVWLGMLPFFLLFLVHHFALLPLVRRRLPMYVGLTAVLLGLFAMYCFTSSRMPDGPPPGGAPERREMMPPPDRPGDMPARDSQGMPPEPEGGLAPLRPDVMTLLLGFLLLGVDLGAYFYVESLRSEQRMKDLQAESLSRQLESLRYQINPHFFMNTLNNIHALVDIEPEKAKESIEEISKMMRILLYEGDSPTIPLSRELDFVRNYISLMRLRYPEDSVRIEVSFPDETQAVVPPLLVASFVENAFKHGISYEEESFIRIRMEMNGGRIVFRCANSFHPARLSEEGGLGLDNIRRRLSLLYGTDYTLSIDDTGGTYEVLLVIPSKPVTTV